MAKRERGGAIIKALLQHARRASKWRSEGVPADEVVERAGMKSASFCARQNRHVGGVAEVMHR